MQLRAVCVSRRYSSRLCGRKTPRLRRGLGLLFLPLVLWADAGVLIPGDRTEPDPAKLSLEEMDVDILVDNLTARVRIRQIFANHTSGVLEGQWVFALPNGAAVSDFAVWDDVTRIPGVILERRRAREIYEELRAQSIDPGLLQQGNGGADDARRSSVFSAKVVPIPGHGFKRVEVEYHESLALSDLQARLAIPLRPEAYQAQIAGRLGIRLTILSNDPISNFGPLGALYPLQVAEQTEHRVVAAFEGRDVTLAEDFAVDLGLAAPGEPKLSVLTYRDPDPLRLSPTAWRPPTALRESGYFLASALTGGASSQGERGPRSVVALFDASLSMQWGKLERSFQALETLLLGLGPNDRFNVLLFDSEVRPFAEALQPGGRESVERALNFVRAGRIRGGTNFDGALAAAVDQLTETEGSAFVVLLSDGGVNSGNIRSGTLTDGYAKLLQDLPRRRRPQTFVFAVGDDANVPLLTALARTGGQFEHVRSTEPIDFKLGSFLGKIGRNPIENPRLEVDAAARANMIYPLQSSWFRGSAARWAGRYIAENVQVNFRVEGRLGSASVEAEAQVRLPREDLEHPYVAREWARARVDALLAAIERDGEERDQIEEIIHWSKRFKFVTPYTSFLAAPRSLLRPRVIRPGDPVLRVRTDEAITSVTALFPFGLVKKLRYLADEDIWQTRFLAPKDTPDGSHEVRLVLRDRDGGVYREKKTFLIASKPPEIVPMLTKQSFRRGERVELKVGASASTRTLTARMYGVAPVNLRWNSDAKANVGSFVIPSDLPAGEYPLKLTAEDFAHNIAVREVALAVLP